MAKFKEKRAKSFHYQAGDVFYVPLALDQKLVSLPRGDGEYIPTSTDPVTFGQILLAKQHSAYIALFSKLTSQAEVAKITLDEVKESDVSFFFTINSSAITRGWWPILGNSAVSKGMPYQAYQRFLEEARTYDFPTWDEISKPIDSELASKLVMFGTSSSSGVVLKAAQFEHGIIKEFFPHGNINNYKPHEEGLIWNVFPEKFIVPDTINM